VDVIVPEPKGGAHSKPEEAAESLRGALVKELARLSGIFHQEASEEPPQEVSQHGGVQHLLQGGGTTGGFGSATSGPAGLPAEGSSPGGQG